MAKRKDATIGEYQEAIEDSSTIEEVATFLQQPLKQVLTSLAILDKHGNNTKAGKLLAEYRNRKSNG